MDALVLLAEEVLDGDLDVVEGDVGGAGGGRVRRLDGLRLDALAALDQEDAEALARVDARDEVVAEDAVRDPLLGAIDDLWEVCEQLSGEEELEGAISYVVLAVGSLGRGRSQSSNVGAW